MQAIAAVVPVLPVPLVAAAVLRGGDGPLEERVAALASVLREAGAVLKLPPAGLAPALAEGLAPLVARGIVQADGMILPAGLPLLRFYAAPVLQKLRPDAAVPQT
jgi:glycerol-3-phosphate O-acyltransferase